MVGSMKGDVLVNEIMYTPAADEPEWVELINTSPDTIDVKHWRISDSNISTKSIITQTDAPVAPGSYFVIAKEASFADYHPCAPFVVASFAALNNSTPDAVVLYDVNFKTIDSVMYFPSWGGQNGKSLERIDTELPSTSPTNWGSSRDTLGSTPGKKNSIARLDYDVSVGSLSQAETVLGGQSVPAISFCLHNNGRRTADSMTINFYYDSDRDSIPEPSELLHTMLWTRSIAAGDSILCIEPLPQLTPGVTPMIVSMDWRRDENVRNNRSFVSIRLSAVPGSIIINEIMYDPLPGQNEWLEFYNRSGQSMNLTSWTFHDRPTLNNVNAFEIPYQRFAVKPGEYMVVAADSSIFQLYENLSVSDSAHHICILNRSGGFSLNNDGDAVVLSDLTGQMIDSVAYLPEWHHPDVVDTKGRSLERINQNIGSNDPRNWSTCTNILGGTPGKLNSINTASVKSTLMLSITPNPFSPDGDGFEDFCVIRYALPMMTSTIKLKIYDIKGRLVRMLANGELAGSQGDLVWNGFDDNKRRARIGVYIIFLEATDRASGKVVTAKAVAVVAAKL